MSYAISSEALTAFHTEETGNSVGFPGVFLKEQAGTVTAVGEADGLASVIAHSTYGQAFGAADGTSSAQGIGRRAYREVGNADGVANVAGYGPNYGTGHADGAGDVAGIGRKAW